MNKKRKPILIYILIVVILGLLIYALPKVTDVFEDTAILETGTIEVKEDAKCFFVRDEAVYEAGDSGTVEYKVEEGIHVRTGATLAKFKADEIEGSEVMSPRSKYSEIIDKVGDHAVRTVNFRSKSSGVICYWADGYESLLTPDTMAAFKYSEAQKITDKAVELGQSPVRKDEPVFKICDNDNWYIMCWIQSNTVGHYEVGSSVSVTLPEGTVEMEVYSITQEGERWKLILWSNNYYKEFAKTRVADGLIVAREYKGLKTETSNIITDGKKPVVLRLRQNGEYELVNVKVKANDGEYSVLQDVSYVDEDGNLIYTVNVYDEILRNPDSSDIEAIKKRAKEGEKDAE